MRRYTTRAAECESEPCALVSSYNVSSTLRRRLWSAGGFVRPSQRTRGGPGETRTREHLAHHTRTSSNILAYSSMFLRAVSCAFRSERICPLFQKSRVIRQTFRRCSISMNTFHPPSFPLPPPVKIRVTRKPRIHSRSLASPIA